MGDPISLLIFGAMFVVMWFFFLRPQMKQQKLTKQFQESIDKGSKVVTTGGIHGKVIKADPGIVMLEIDNNVKIRLERSAISMDLSKAAYGEPPLPSPKGETKANTNEK